MEFNHCFHLKVMLNIQFSIKNLNFMKINSLLFGLLLFCVSITLFAQKTVDVTLQLRDGSQVSGTTSLPDVQLNTDYGKLLIPVKNISSIRVGLSCDQATRDKISTLLKSLNSSDEELKKNAYNEIIKIGIKAIPAIDQYINDPKNLSIEYVGEFTPDAALNELRSAFSVDQSNSYKDMVLIDGEYNMGGDFDFAKLEVKTEYGVLNIPKEKIKQIEVSFISTEGSGEKIFKLNASKHISSNQNGGWLKTGIVLKAGQKFSIHANGEVVLASLSNQKYQPDGSYTTSTGEKVKGTGNNYDESGVGNGTNYPSYGNVVYRIGDSTTQVLKAGAKFTGSANASGILYISIYETVYNAANSGSYTVKIKSN